MPRRYLARFALVLALALTLSGCPRRNLGQYGSSTWVPPIRATPDIAALEQQMHQRVNQDRAQRGLPPLQWDARLADIGRAHSLDMRNNRFFSHSSPNTGSLEDRIAVAGYLALEMRENLAAAGDIHTAENNLLDTPGHYENIVATGVTHLGIGSVRGGSSGDPRILTITQVFARPTFAESPQQATPRIVSAMQATRAHRQLPALQSHPLLEQVARDQVVRLADHLPQHSIDQVGAAMSHALNSRHDHGLRSMQLSAQLVFNATDYQVPASVHDPGTRAFGIGVAPARDEKGRPRLKVLVLFGK